MMFRVIATFSFACIALVTLLPSLGAQTVSESTIYSFSGSDGNSPNGVIQASDGNFYGTALIGGSSTGTGECAYFGTDTGCGIVYKITSSGTLTVLHDFAGVGDGSYPGPLVEGTDGNLYGTTAFGGYTNTCEIQGQPKPTYSGCGTIFKITPSGGFSLLYIFSGGNDGGNPNLLVLGNDGNFYGTANTGGAYGSGAFGNGTFFKVTSSGTLTVLYNFTGSSDGALPNAIVQGSDGRFYGTTQWGGDLTACQFNNFQGDIFDVGCGTVFAVTAAGSLTTIYTFTGGSDGANVVGVATPAIVIPHPGNGLRMGGGPTSLLFPNALTEGSDGNFYGVTFGFSSTQPTVFRITPAGNLTTLYTFTGDNDGGGSDVSLTLASDGNFYGSSGNAIFQITPAGNFSVPYTFTTATNGIGPGLLTQGNSGDLYGATASGGNSADCNGDGCGTIFQMAFSNGPAGPVNLSLSSTTDDPGTAVTLTWSVSNAFSDTLQQCYAFVQGGAPGAGTWVGLQTGALSDGVYSGSAKITPTAAGTYTYALTCGGQESGFATLTVPPPAVTTTSLPDGYISVAYSATLAADNGLAPYAWSVTSGSLPADLTLNATTGVISGTPTQAGTSNFTVTVEDSESQPITATANLAITVVAAAISANPSTLSITAPGSSASTTLTISGFATSSIKLACSGLPSEASCTFGTPTTSNGSETVSLQIGTTAASSARLLVPLNRQLGNTFYVLALPGAIWLGCLWGTRRSRKWTGVFLALLLLATISMTACGVSGGAANGNNLVSTNPGTPEGSTTVVVTATGGAQSATVNLTVNLQ
jgi:uncharacterized repeat protein (TIGR03803 family)